MSIRNKTYINFVSAEMIHFILNIEKSQFGTESCFGLSNAVFKHKKLIQTEKAMPRVT